MADELPSRPGAGTPPPPLPRAPLPRRERLPGTYAGSYLQDDPNPASAALLLDLVFSAMCLLEIVHLFAEIFSGYSIERDAYAWVRVLLTTVSVLLLRLGFHWARWPLAMGACVFGAGVAISTMSEGSLGLIQHAAGLVAIPLGFTYLGLGLYAGTSSSVTALAGQRDKSGKIFVVTLMLLVCGLTLLGLLAMRPLCLAWQIREQQKALEFADESIRAISEHWDYRVFDQRADADYIAQWPVEAKKAVLSDMSRYGAIRQIDRHSIKVLGSLDVAKGLRWHGYYTSQNTLDHSHGSMSLELERGPLSPWRITAWTLRPTP